MKRLAILWAMAALAAGCSEATTSEQPAPVEDSAVRVEFRLDAPIATDAALEPMTRATAYRNVAYNKLHLLLLKRVDARWIVDAMDSVKIQPNTEWYSKLTLTEDISAVPFSYELRPGKYHLVAVLNADATRINRDLKPGKVVDDDEDPSFRIPPLLTYTIANHPANGGYRMLYREVFVAVADFTVPKSGDLHGSGMPPLKLTAERRVGRFRILFKYKRSPIAGNIYDPTEHTAKMIFTALSDSFPEGIDALGGMYYGSPGLTELPWCMSTTGKFHPSGEGSYQICQTNATVFSPFLFADPAVEKLEFEISQIKVTGQSDRNSYKTDRTFTRSLAASKTTGIVFEPGDREFGDKLIEIVEATDDQGVPEDAAALFDEFFEWNAESY